MTTSAIEAEGLVKTFGKVRALGGIDMVAREGTVFGLLGPNGAGKTTAIRVLSTLLKPDSGRASVGGFDVVRQPGEVRRLIGLTGQYAAVDELLSGQGHARAAARVPRGGARSRAKELLQASTSPMPPRRSSSSNSGGMRRRLDLARAWSDAPGSCTSTSPRPGSTLGAGSSSGA